MVIIEEASPPPPSTHPRKHHVFLSFRGEDTRNNFTGHLYRALDQKGIITFMDDQLTRGEEISQELLQAIEQSKISIIVFSKDYASSKWCLDELVKILDCKKSKQQIVLPVFFKVDPSDIRNHRGSFGEGLASLECKFKDNMEKVQEWKSALKHAATLSGWTISEKCSEASVIQKIIDQISKVLINSTSLDVAKYPVGIEPRVQQIHKRLGVEGRDVHMVGIWGAGGIGKTTIARAVYNSIAHEFDGCCFLENVRENSKGAQGFVELQKKLLCEILRGTLEVANEGRGITMIKDRLQYKSVLLVLDDVSDMDQLEKLAGECSWFGRGSKIIITTRDRKLLTCHCVDLIYEVPKLAYYEALELFSMNAFKRSRPLDDFAEHAERAICYAQGLPLVLTVLGSSLCNENLEAWEDALDGFKSKKIQDVLEISYRGLDDRVKEAFLDIACFFKGEKREYVVQILEACGRKRHDINVLIGKALISVRSEGEIWMHNLIEEMGRDIVQKQSPNNPGERSRLWFHKDVYSVLTENIGTKEIISIKVELPEDSDVICFSGTTFSNLRNLRLFIYRAGHYSGVVENVPKSLRVVDWPNCHLQFSASDLPRELVLLNMPTCRITGLDNGLQHLRYLTSLNLRGCQYLTKVSDLSGIPNLQHLDLNCCYNLVEVHPSVGFLDKLTFLSLNVCWELETFPIEVRWKSMRELSLPFCRRLESFISIVHNMGSIKKLELRCSGIKEITWIGRCTSLEVLDLSGTPIKQLPSSIGDLIFLEELDAYDTLIEELPSSIEHLTSLKQLRLDRSSLKELPPSIGCLICLEVLDVSETLIKGLPTSVTNIASLRELKVSKTAIRELPSSIGCLTSLKKLNASKTLIEELPLSIGDLTSLRKLKVSNTPITELPSSIGCLTSLEELDVYETLIEELPLSIGDLTSLRKLKLSKTPIKELPSSIGCLTSLKKLDGSETLIEELPLSIGDLTSLTNLKVSTTPIRELPSSIGCLTSLKKLDASETLIEELPLSIGYLICLNRLKLKGCANLTNLPHSVYGGLQNLVELDLSYCLKLVTFPSRPSALVSSSAESLPLTLPTNSNDGHDDCGPLLFPSLRRLYLSGTSFDSLPAWCISNFLEYLDLGGCKKLRDISELPASIKGINLDDCVSLERDSKLSNMLEQKDTLGDLRWMNLSNCHRLVHNRGMNMVSKMAKALLDQLPARLAMFKSSDPGKVNCGNIILPSLRGIEVPDWFDSGKVDTTVLRGDNEFMIKIQIPRILNGKTIGLVVCAVFEIKLLGAHFYGDFQPRFFIWNRGIQNCGYWQRDWCYGSSIIRKLSADDGAWVFLACIDFKVVDHEVLFHFICSPLSSTQSIIESSSLKSYGVHLANMQETDSDHVSGEDLALEIYRPSNAGSSDIENEEGDDHPDGEQQQQEEEESHLTTTRLEDLGRQTNIGRAMLAFLRCFGITCL